MAFCVIKENISHFPVKKRVLFEIHAKMIMSIQNAMKSETRIFFRMALTDFQPVF